MSNALETLKEILSGKLPDAEVQALLAELTIASGNGSVSINGDATEAVIVTGSKNIIGNNNQVIVNHGTDPDELIKMLRQVFQHNKEVLQQQNQKPPTQLTGADGLGNLSNVPELPANFVPRPDALEHLKALVLGTTEQAVAVTGKAQKVGVQGMAGIGKTVLATALARDQAVQRQFPNGIVWVTLGQEPTVLVRQAQVARALTGEQKEFKDVQDGKAFLSEFLADKACLLILDDVWQLDHAAAFNVLGARSLMLITSRDRGLIDNLGALECQLDVLSDKLALQLLAQSSEQTEETLPSEALDVAQECGNLPLALAMVGTMAKGDPDFWSELLEALRNASLEEIEEEFPNYPYPNLLRAIKVSVDALQPEEKECYLDFAVFPEDTPIPIAVLQTIWEPKGLKPLNLKKIIKALVNRSLVQQDKLGRLTLHDLQLDYVRKQFDNLSTLHGSLLNAYEAKCSNGWAAGPKDGYFFEHLGYHLVKAGRQQELRELLLKFDWLHAKLEATNANTLITDFDWLPEDRELRLVQGAIRLSANFLAQNPMLLWSQLYGRLMSQKELPGIKEMLDQSPQAIWFRTLTPSLIPPGGPLLRTLEGHSAPVTAVAITPNGKQALSASWDKTLKLWDLQTGVCQVTLSGHRGKVTAVAITPDGKQAFSASWKWMKLWNLQTGACQTTLEGHNAPINAVAITPDGKQALSASGDKTLKLWNLQTGVCQITLEGHSYGVEAVAIRPSGKQALSASWDKTLKLWDLQTGVCQITLEGHSGPVYAVVISPDGNQALSASWDKTLKLWDLQTGVCVKTLEGHRNPVYAVAITPNGKQALSASKDRTLKLWDLQTGVCQKTLEGHSNLIDALAISLDGKQALSASWDRTLKLWDLQTGICQTILEGHSDLIDAVAISSDGKQALSASKDKTLKLWNLPTGVCQTTLEGHSYRVYAVTISPDGKQALLASKDKTLRMWDLQTDVCLKTFSGHSDCVKAVAITPDGKQALSASDDKTLKLWDLQTDVCLKTFFGHSDCVKAVAITPDGKQALSASDDKTLKLWDLQIGVCLKTLSGHSDWVEAVAITRDGEQALSASKDRTLKLWDLQTGVCLKTLSGHSNLVDDITITPDGKQALSVSWDSTLKLWDLNSSKCLATWGGESPLLCCAVSPDGVTVVAGESSRRLHILRLEGIK